MTRMRVITLREKGFPVCMLVQVAIKEHRLCFSPGDKLRIARWSR